jgi:DNA-binding MarR family transcriptional regulator
MTAVSATLSEQLELSVTRLAHVLLRGGTGLSRSAASVLHRLAAAGPQRVTELAAWESIAQPSATALVGRLEGQGLVVRTGDPDDGRAVLVAITPAGEALLAERREGRARSLGARLAALDPGERTTLAAAVPLLEQLAEAQK